MIRLAIAIAIAGCGRGNFELDADVDGPAVVVDARPPVVNNVVFATSTQQLATTFGPGFAGADAICATRAAAAGLIGTFVAYLSTSGFDARDRLMAARGWVRTDGKPFGDRIEDILTGAVYYPPALDELGNSVDSIDAVATGTRSDGTDDEDCVGYTSSNASDYIDIGIAIDGRFVWEADMTASCASQYRLYCFETDKTAPLVPPVVAGRRAFVSTQSFTPGGGLAAADALCASDATLGGLSGTFLALLGTSTASASSRFSLSGTPWYRLDGAQIATTPLDLMAQHWQTTLDLTVTGDYLGLPVYTGGGLLSALDVNATCDDWTSTAGTGDTGVSDRTDSALYLAQGPCTSSYQLYCLEP